MPRRRTSISTPIARVVSIGDELVFGRTVDTNAAQVCRALTDAGYRVAGVRQVGDAQGDIAEALATAARDAALVIATGGLGPTDDDRSRHALADVLGRDLRFSAAGWAQVRAHYRRLGRTAAIPLSNRRQALVPQGARLLINQRGTAPGLWAKHGSCRIALLPGVPHEMRDMLPNVLAVAGRAIHGVLAPTIGEVWFAGIGESAAQERIADLFTEHDPQVGITVSELGHLTLRVVGSTAVVMERCAALRRRLKDVVLPLAGLAPSLRALLARRRQTITTAESCTAGAVALQIASVPGASAVLREALVAYHPQVKQRLLGVSPTVIRTGVVSEVCVRAMAEGARIRSDATYAIATTGIAGPGGGTRACPVGTVWLAVAGPHGTTSRCVHLAGDRERIQRRAAAEALRLAWESIRPDSSG